MAGPETRFMLLNAARTGSTMLAHMLNSHPDVRCHGEVLGPGKGKAGDRLVGVDYASDPAREGTLMEQRDRDPVGFLQQWVWGDDAPRAAGFKIKYEELTKPDFELIRDWLTAERSVKVIHLVRQNRLKRLVSEVTAVRIYGAYQLKDRDERPAPPRFELSVEECRADFEKQQRREARFGRMFADHEVLDVTYEGLLDAGGTAVRDVQGFLGVEPVELRTTTEKMNPDELNGMLQNYDELRRAFRGTEHAAYFET